MYPFSQPYILKNTAIPLALIFKLYMRGLKLQVQQDFIGFSDLDPLNNKQTVIDFFILKLSKIR